MKFLILIQLEPKVIYKLESKYVINGKLPQEDYCYVFPLNNFKLL